MREKRPSQKDAVLKHLKTGASITGPEAREKLGIGHLPRRIGDLKEEGWLIETSMIPYRRSFDGKMTKIAKYWMNPSNITLFPII